MEKQKNKLPVRCLIIFLLCAAYVGMAFYYQNRFAANTWINDIYCCGKTVEEINGELLERTVIPDTFVIRDIKLSGGSVEEHNREIILQDVDYTADYTEGLRGILAVQKPLLWAKSLIFPSWHTVMPKFSYDGEKLKEQLEEIVSRAHGSEDYRIVYSEREGYSLYDGLQDCLDDKKVFQSISYRLLAGECEISLTRAGCYYDIPLSEEQKTLAALWDKLEAFLDGAPFCDWGDGAEKPDGAVMAYFLKKDEKQPYLPFTDDNGCLQIDEEAVKAFVEKMAEHHETQGKKWEFKSTRGETVTVEGKTYGTVIDRKAETEWLTDYLQALASGNEQRAGAVHIPRYTQEAFCRSSTSLGGTYIEVDMGDQKLYYYENGELMLETDVVTGNTLRGRGTPEGINYVYAKQRNRVLRGPDYASPVSYWMPVNRAIGIHDASWRREFGGEIYKTAGSHGCINVPRDVMPELYEMVEIGTPVVMFYGKE